jgi:hypothetical protein
VDGAGQRVGPVAKVVYPNRDSYYGGYSGTKAGAGLYIAASGAAHIGRYEVCLCWDGAGMVQRGCVASSCF